MTSVLFAYTLIFTTSASAVYGAVLIIILGSMAWSLLQDDPLHNASVRVGWLLGTPVYVGGTLAAVALVRDFDPTGAWVLLTMVLAWGSDTSAYFVGRKFGKTKLVPRISPKKTLEGSAGDLGLRTLHRRLLIFSRRVQARVQSFTARLYRRWDAASRTCRRLPCVRPKRFRSGAVGGDARREAKHRG